MAATTRHYHVCPHKDKSYGGRRQALGVCAHRARTRGPGSSCRRCTVWEDAAKAMCGPPASLRPSDAAPEEEGGVDDAE